MYSDFIYQFINLARFVLAFFIVYILWPRLLFRSGREGGLDGLVSGYVLMVCLTIAVGYVLVVIKLYEFLSLTAVLLVITFRSAIRRYGHRGGARELGLKITTWVYDVFDGLVSPGRVLANLGRNRLQSIKHFLQYRFSGFTQAGNTILFAIIFVWAVYLRFYDALIHAAPAMSDAYVTLAWMKYIENRFLFHDGIYPQGFHIYLTVLRKFSAIDSLLVLKYTGPLNGVLTGLGIYFAVSRWSGRTSPGLVAAFVFGVLSGYLPMEFDRQASTNSQEFALMFLVPAFYFASAYLKTGQRTHFWPAAACFTIIGWVHTLVFTFLVVGVFLLVISHLLLIPRKSAGASLQICLAGVGAGVLSVLPVVVGLAMGREFHSASAQFVSQEFMAVLPDITLFDQAALGALAFFLVVSLLAGRSRQSTVMPLFLALVGVASYAMYYALGPLTGKALLAYHRMAPFWSLLVPIGLGMGWSALVRLAPGERLKQLAGVLVCLGLVVCTAVYLKPVPPVPYKMQHDSMVDQYLRIVEEFRPTEWAIASVEENYAICLGRGWHLRLADLLEYNPTDRRLTRQVNGATEELSVKDVFIFKEKNMFRAKVSGAEEVLQATYERRAGEYRELDRWLENYRANHDNLSLYYEDADIQVFRIHQPRSREEEFRKIWGGGVNGGRS